MEKRKIIKNEEKGHTTVVTTTFENGLAFVERNGGNALLLVVDEGNSDEFHIAVYITTMLDLGAYFAITDELPLVGLLELCDIDLLSFARGDFSHLGKLSAIFIQGLDEALNTVGQLRVFLQDGRVYAELTVGDHRCTCNFGDEWQRYFTQSSPTP